MPRQFNTLPPFYVVKEPHPHAGRVVAELPFIARRQRVGVRQRYVGFVSKETPLG